MGGKRVMECEVPPLDCLVRVALWRCREVSQEDDLSELKIEVISIISEFYLP
jgi:hypothetical protein